MLLALQHFDVYLCSSPFVIDVFTDHNPLVFVNKMKNNNQRLLRWSIILQQYHVNIKHIRGSDNGDSMVEWLALWTRNPEIVSSSLMVAGYEICCNILRQDMYPKLLPG
jgi:hypothetical protein